jgi:hypothetical protein
MNQKLALILWAIDVVGAFRVDHRSQMLAHGKEPPVTNMGDGVSIAADTAETDFSFMTFGDFSRPAVADNFGTWLNKIFGRRRHNEGNIKEEVANKHWCAKPGHGSDDQTYYASSFCYWLPEIQKEGEQSQNVGLVWDYGRDVPGDTHRKPMCGGLSGAGKCMKCTACHNNALSADALLGLTSQAEDLTGYLSKSCLGELEIEERCLAQFDEAEPELASESKQCLVDKNQYETAVQDHKKAKDEFASWGQIIERLPDEISNLAAEITRQEEIIQSSSREAMTARVAAVGGCEALQEVNGYSKWYSDLEDTEIDTTDILKRMLISRCVQGTPSFHACRQCTIAKQAIEDASAKEVAARNAKNTAEDDKASKETELVYAHGNRTRLERDVLPGLEEAEKTAGGIWTPKADHCEVQMKKYVDDQTEFVRTCTPTHYPKSCEKECLELSQKEAGCGVYEGSSVGDNTGRGGVQLTCRPPQKSWIHGPWTYGAEEEGTGRQCGRFGQLKHVAQTVLKKGVMQKKGRWWGWRDRFFFLESGDQVHSGILYYYEHDPATHPNQIPRHDKKIILWDAKHCVTSGWSCLTISHFYRNYEFCPREGREDWAAKIQAEIHRPRR